MPSPPYLVQAVVRRFIIYVNINISIEEMKKIFIFLLIPNLHRETNEIKSCPSFVDILVCKQRLRIVAKSCVMK